MEGTITLSRKVFLTVILACSLISAALAYFYSANKKPESIKQTAKTEITTEQNKTTANNILTVKTKVTKPDGTVVERERQVDKTKTEENKKQVLSSDIKTEVTNHSLKARIGLEADFTLKNVR